MKILRKLPKNVLVSEWKKIYISGLLFTARVDLPTLERGQILLSNFCGDYCFVYIDNKNIKSDCLYQDGLHLLDTGKYGSLLAPFVSQKNMTFVSRIETSMSDYY